jgi:hypothetical protein
MDADLLSNCPDPLGCLRLRSESVKTRAAEEVLQNAA